MSRFLPSLDEFERQLAERRRNALNIPELKGRMSQIEDAFNAQQLVLQAFTAQQTLMDQISSLPFDDLYRAITELRSAHDGGLAGTREELEGMLTEARERNLETTKQIQAVSAMLGELYQVMPKREPVDHSGQLDSVKSELTTNMGRLEARLHGLTEASEAGTGSYVVTVATRDDKGDISEILVEPA